MTITVGGAPGFVLGITPSGGVGEPYSYRFATTGSPTPTVTTASALPPGLSLATDGTLSGTPTTAGTYPMTLRASNGLGSTVSYDVTVTVRALPKVSMTSASATDPASGTTVVSFLTEANETFTVTLTLPTHAKLGTAKATGTIAKPLNP